jgi:hypothetical protein
MVGYSGLIELLEQTWRKIHLFHANEIPMYAVIVVGNQNLINRPKSAPMLVQTDAWMVDSMGAPQVFISGDELDSSTAGYDLVVHLLHAAVHSFCYANDIQEMSKGNHYHNSYFRRACQDFGLLAEYSDASHGYTRLSLDKESVARYADDIEALENLVLDLEIIPGNTESGHIR